MNILNIVSEEKYKNWLNRKAANLQSRDGHNFGKSFSINDYRRAIEKAIKETNGKDYYTGEKLDWSLISKFNGGGGRKEMKKFQNLPTIDHYDPEKNDLTFKICAWITNDMKNYLTEKEFLIKCKKIIKNLS